MSGTPSQRNGMCIDDRHVSVMPLTEVSCPRRVSTIQAKCIVNTYKRPDEPEGVRLFGEMVVNVADKGQDNWTQVIIKGEVYKIKGGGYLFRANIDQVRTVLKGVRNFEVNYIIC